MIIRELLEKLRSHRIKRGDIVCIHSDITSFGIPNSLRTKVLQEGLDVLMDSYIDTFKELVGEHGIILMPTFTYSACENEIFDVSKTPSTVGALTEYFRKLPSTKRSIHPVFSFSAWGKNAEEFLKLKSLDCFGEESFFEKLYDLNIKYLFFGVDLQHSATFVHYAEEKAQVYYRFYKYFDGKIKNNDDLIETKVRYYVRNLDLSYKDNWYPMENKAIELGVIDKFEYNGAPIMITKAKEVDKYLQEELNKNKEFLIIINKEEKGKMSKLLDNVELEVITENKGKILYKKNPMKFLVENELIVQTGNGLFVIKGILVDILNKIDNLICDIARKVDAEAVYVPYLMDWDNTQRTNYLKSFSNQAMMIKPYEKERKTLSPHEEYEGMVSPATCYHYTCTLKNKTIRENHAVTLNSRCTRIEKGDLNDLRRLTNFTMREIIFYGTSDYCTEMLNKLQDMTTEMYDDVLDLTYRIETASDPFFGEDAEMKKVAQILSGSKLETQTLLPYDNSTISIGSFNNHGGVFYERFNINSENPEINTSGCVAWGYERMLYALICQKGVDFSSPYYKGLLD